MVIRTIQYQNGSYFTVIPGALIDVLGIRPGDKVSFGIEKGKIMIVPAENPTKTAAGAASDRPITRDVPACQ